MILLKMLFRTYIQLMLGLLQVLTHSLTHAYSLTHSLTYLLTHSLLLTYSLTYLLTYWLHRRGIVHSFSLVSPRITEYANYRSELLVRNEVQPPHSALQSGEEAQRSS
jgi:hypothetical protein